jgi:hypothetical protein
MAWTGILLATQGPGLDLGRGEYQPEPDFGVIDADYGAGQRLVEGAYLLAEVVSATDHVSVPGTDRQWIDVKRDLYRGHEHCEAVLVIVEDRMEVGLDLKTETGWQSSVLAGGAELVIPAFGLRCFVSDLYGHAGRLRRAARRGTIFFTDHAEKERKKDDIEKSM